MSFILNEAVSSKKNCHNDQICLSSSQSLGSGFVTKGLRISQQNINKLNWKGIEPCDKAPKRDE